MLRLIQEKIGLNLSPLITIISESSSNYGKIIKFANQSDEIVECYATTGEVLTY